LAYLRPAGWKPGDASNSSQFTTRLSNTRAMLGQDPPPAPLQPYTPTPPDTPQQMPPGYLPQMPTSQTDNYGATFGAGLRGLTSPLGSAPSPARQPPDQSQPRIPTPPPPGRRPLATVAAPSAPLRVDSVAALRRRLGGLWGFGS